MGGGFAGPGMALSGYGGSVQPAMVSSVGGAGPGYVANVTTTTTEYTPVSGYGGAMPVNSVVRPGMMTSGLPPLPPRPITPMGAIGGGVVGGAVGGVVGAPVGGFSSSYYSSSGSVPSFGAGTIVNTGPVAGVPMMGGPIGGTVYNSPAFGGMPPMAQIQSMPPMQPPMPPM